MLTKWKIKGEVIQLPKSWSKNQVLSFLNTDIKVCENCGKVDINKNHYPECNPSEQAQREYDL